MTYGHGWALRNAIIWQKPNALPSSAKDRYTNSYEYVFMFTKNEKYYFERQFEPYDSIPHGGQFGSRKGVEEGDDLLYNVQYDPDTDPMRFYGNPGRNKRDIWSISTQSSTVPHFAQYPVLLCETPIEASCPKYLCKKCGRPREKIYVDVTPIQGTDGTDGTTEQLELLKSMGSDENGNYLGTDKKDYDGTKSQNPAETKRRILEGLKRQKEERWTDCGCNAGFVPGVVLDPFVGSGTTCLVARKLKRRWVGVDISEAFLREAEGKIENFQRPDGKDVTLTMAEQGFRAIKRNLDDLTIGM
jgi:hypothetical protein